VLNVLATIGRASAFADGPEAAATQAEAAADAEAVEEAAAAAGEAMERSKRALRALRLRGEVGIDAMPEEVCTAHANWAVRLSREGRHDEARALAQEVFDRRRAQLGVAHPLTHVAAANLAAVTQAAGAVFAAEAPARAALASARAAFGHYSLQAGRAASELATLLARLTMLEHRAGRLLPAATAATARRLEIVQLRQLAFTAAKYGVGVGDAEVLAERERLCEALIESERFEEAATLLEGMLEILADAGEPETEDVRKLVRRLFDVLLRSGDYAAARVQLARLQEWHAQEHGEADVLACELRLLDARLLSQLGEHDAALRALDALAALSLPGGARKTRWGHRLRVRINVGGADETAEAERRQQAFLHSLAQEHANVIRAHALSLVGDGSKARREVLLREADELVATAEPLPPSAGDVAIGLAERRLTQIQPTRTVTPPPLPAIASVPAMPAEPPPSALPTKDAGQGRTADNVRKQLGNLEGAQKLLREKARQAAAVARLARFSQRPRGASMAVPKQTSADVDADADAAVALRMSLREKYLRDARTCSTVVDVAVPNPKLLLSIAAAGPAQAGVDELAIEQRPDLGHLKRLAAAHVLEMSMRGDED
jgi:hypothetical protein